MVNKRDMACRSKENEIFYPTSALCVTIDPLRMEEMANHGNGKSYLHGNLWFQITCAEQLGRMHESQIDMASCWIRLPLASRPMADINFSRDTIAMFAFPGRTGNCLGHSMLRVGVRYSSLASYVHVLS